METSTYQGSSGSVGEQVRDQVQDVSQQVQETASDVVGQAQEQVQQLTGKARGQVREQIDQRLSQAGEQFGSSAHDLRSVASELRRIDKESTAKVADQLADRVDGVARYLSRGGADTILRDAEDFGRRQPWAVLAGGLALGFVASRLLKASSSQRFASSGPSSTDYTSTRSRDEIRAGLEGSGYVSGGASATGDISSQPMPSYAPPAPHAPR